MSCIYPFDIKVFTKYDCPSILVQGSRRSGKTTYIRKILHYYKKLGHPVMTITGTRDSEYIGFNNMIYNSETMLNLNELKCKGFERRSKALVILFDDITFAFSQLSRSELIMALYQNGRHLNIIPIMVVHGLKALEKTSRDNVDIFIITKINGESQKKAVYDMCSPEMQFQDFKKFLTHFTKGFDKLLFDCYEDKWYYVTA